MLPIVVFEGKVSKINRFLKDQIFSYIFENPYRLRELLDVYTGLLKEQKVIHELGCIDCKKEPCRRSSWFFMGVQEVQYVVALLSKELS